MKILFTGGGSGGHFYPIIAIAEALTKISQDEHLISPSLYFMAPAPYDAGLLLDNHIEYLPIMAGKLRRYFSFQNAVDIVKSAVGVFQAVFTIFRIFPDVIVGKGGYGSFPALLAGRLFGIPVLIHESDSRPGRVNRWAGKFAKRSAVSLSEAAAFFPKERVAHTGNPIRHGLLAGSSATRFMAQGKGDGAPIIFVLGGSLGSVTLNEAIFKILPALLSFYIVVHQTGPQNLADIVARAAVLLQKHPRKERYQPIGYLATEDMVAVGQEAGLIISRAGSTIFEIAAWGKPAILIPITDSNGDHQRENAYAYAREGAAEVIEEANLTPSILNDEIEKIMHDSARRRVMEEAAARFAKRDAAEIIAREIIKIALTHEE